MGLSKGSEELITLLPSIFSPSYIFHYQAHRTEVYIPWLLVHYGIQ